MGLNGNGWTRMKSGLRILSDVLADNRSSAMSELEINYKAFVARGRIGILREHNVPRANITMENASIA